MIKYRIKQIFSSVNENILKSILHYLTQKAYLDSYFAVSYISVAIDNAI